ncbi:hypothetical protein [Methylomonas sp. AM2-LC]|uniref:hypothetical protein n=1 Tax=Methylomonas sp. AM2-LC TaxID=3153301 RepID=UPI00326328F1
MSKLGAAPVGIYADDGVTLLGVMDDAGSQLGLNKTYSTFSKFISDYLGNKLGIGNCSVLGNRATSFYYDGTTLRATDGRQAIRAVGGNASLNDVFYTGAKSTLSYSTHIAQNNILAIGIKVANYLFNESLNAPFSGSGTITTNLTVEASIEYPIGGTRQRITFNAANQGVIAPGTDLDSDLIVLTNLIPAGAKFRIWEMHLVTGTDSVMVNRNCYLPDGGDNLVYRTTTPGNFGATNVVTGTFAGATIDGGSYGQQGIRPACIFGITDIPLPAVAAIGDSRVYGTFEEPDSSRFLGSIERMMGSLLTTQGFGVGGETGAQFVSANGAKRRATINKYFTHAVCDYGVNDIYQSGILTTTALAAMLNNIANALPSIQIYACTIRPVTSSTDGWITATNQSLSNAGGVNTAAISNAARIAFNWMLRTGGTGKGAISAPVPGGLPGVYDYFDLANDVECNSAGALTQDGGFWLPLTASLTCSCTSNTITLSANPNNYDLTGSIVVSSPGSTGNSSRVLYQDSVNPLVWYIDGRLASYTWASGVTVFNNSTSDGLHELPGSNRLHSPASNAKFPLYAFT